MLHVALSIFHRKEDSQYHPHNLIPAIIDVADRLNPADFAVRTFYPLCHRAERWASACNGLSG
jgi:hypothetical protein